MEKYYLRVAAASPEVAIAAPSKNLERIKNIYSTATMKDVSLVVFPELSITGYTIGDLVSQTELLSRAKQALLDFAKFTADKPTVAIVGLPFQLDNALYNVAAVVSGGLVHGLVPKQNLPTYNEFYEKRWYQAWGFNQPNTTVMIGEQSVPFGVRQVFSIGEVKFGIEICEDLWVPRQPSIELAAAGALIIANPSASPETVTKSAYRRGLVAQTSARNMVGYVYAASDQSESTSEIVMSGHLLINEMGTLLAERAPFTEHQDLLTADIDIQHILRDRRLTTNFPTRFDFDCIDTGVTPTTIKLERFVDPEPFVPKSNDSERYDEILNIQATGLAMRLKSSGIQKVTLGLSGGLDSTLALLVAVRAFEILKLPTSNIFTLTMPSHASSARTQTNAKKLAKVLRVSNEEIVIAKLAEQQLKALGHDGKQDVTFENTQARLRQALIFNKSNQLGALTLGTGDLSEIALGWATYNGDHMSGYNPNASIPKSLVKFLVRRASENLSLDAREILEDILDTPISPELTGNGSDITQNTEDLVGPYVLHDFFLYHFLRWGEGPDKIRALANYAFKSRFTATEIDKWLTVFLKRFYQNQWKRQAMPDGAKVGLSLSPKGDWRMPPEAELVLK